MNDFTGLFEHNEWANRLVLDALRRVPAAFLGDEGRPGAGPMSERLRHLLAVERAFLDALEANPQVPEPPSSLEGLSEYADTTIARYRSYLGQLADPSAKVFIPWWERSFTVSDCLHQVIAHSAQHRAELAWELARAGVDTGEMDYIIWANEHGS